ncbi:MAG: hypothetical protein HYV16_02665 [Gammaproteobacteria bacterium]|nr:hypothetical protein [Gammaproteobacteria bacterium]
MLAAVSQASSAPAPGGKEPCKDTPYNQFDFWLGDWKVHGRDGKLVGYNRIERVLNGCALRESYRTPKGYRGTSLSIYDRSRRRWHQTWVDNRGMLLVLEGEFREGRMLLSGADLGEDGSRVLHRIAWSARDHGHVRQIWESSRNEGRDWQLEFDGDYRAE